MIHSTTIKLNQGARVCSNKHGSLVSEEAVNIWEKLPQLERAADAKSLSAGMLGVFRWTRQSGSQSFFSSGEGFGFNTRWEALGIVI